MSNIAVLKMAGHRRWIDHTRYRIYVRNLYRPPNRMTYTVPLDKSLHRSLRPGYSPRRQTAFFLSDLILPHQKQYSHVRNLYRPPNRMTYHWTKASTHHFDRDTAHVDRQPSFFTEKPPRGFRSVPHYHSFRTSQHIGEIFESLAGL